MNQLLESQLFSLLTENSLKVSNEEMKNAYGEFLEQVKTLTQSENDYSVIFRSLNLIRIELIALQSLSEYEQGKKCA